MTIESQKNESAQYISGKIAQELAQSRRATKWWSFATHGSTIIVIVFSALAAVIVQITDVTSIPVKNIATLLSLIVTIISTTQSKLGFERKWIANRMTQSALRQLEIDEEMKTPVAELAKSLKEIRAKHDQAITASTD
jgi:hypothetical protein